MESLEREQKQIDCQADELETELRSVMNTGIDNFFLAEMYSVLIFTIFTVYLL